MTPWVAYNLESQHLGNVRTGRVGGFHVTFPGSLLSNPHVFNTSAASVLDFFPGTQEIVAAGAAYHNCIGAAPQSLAGFWGGCMSRGGFFVKWRGATWIHRCPFRLALLKNRGPWFTWGSFHLPGPSIFFQKSPYAIPVPAQNFPTVLLVAFEWVAFGQQKRLHVHECRNRCGSKLNRVTPVLVFGSICHAILVHVFDPSQTRTRVLPLLMILAEH